MNTHKHTQICTPKYTHAYTYRCMHMNAHTHTHHRTTGTKIFITWNDSHWVGKTGVSVLGNLVRVASKVGLPFGNYYVSSLYNTCLPQSSFVSLNVFEKALFFHWMLCSSAMPLPLPQAKTSCSQKSLPDTLLIFLIIILLLSIPPLGRYEAPRMCRCYLGLSTVQANYELPLTYV